MEELNVYFRGICDLFSIKQAVPHQLWDGITADGGTTLLATRLIHNKLIIIFTDVFRCYSLPIDPFFLTQLTSVIVVALIIMGFFIAPVKVKLLYLPFLVIPLIFIFHIYLPFSMADILISYSIYLYALCFFTILLGIKNITKISKRILQQKNK